MKRKKDDDPPPPKAKQNKGKDKNIRTTLKAVKKGTSAPGSSNAVINEKISISTVNNTTSVQAVLPTPVPSTSCTFAPINTSKKYQDKVDKTGALKKEKEKNKTTTNEQKQVRFPSCGGTDHSRFSRNLRPMNKSKTKLSKPKNTVEKAFVIKASLANICKYSKFVTMIQEVVGHITQLVYAGSIFANYYFLKLLENGEEVPVFTQNLLYKIFSIFAG